MHKLAALSGPTKGTIYGLVDDSVSLGRADANTIIVDDLSISRHHALLSRAGEEYRIRDLNSANGTYVNGQRVAEAILQAGDTVELGVVRFTYRPDRVPQSVPPPAPVSQLAQPTPAQAPKSTQGRATTAVVGGAAPNQPKSLNLVSPPTAAATAGGAGLPAPASARTVEPTPPPTRPLAIEPARANAVPTAGRPRTLKIVALTCLVCWALGGAIWWGSARVLNRGGRAHAAVAANPPVPALAAARPESLAETARSSPAKVAAVAGLEYRDKQGRFTCRVPVGWAVEEEREEARSNVRFHRGTAEVRVIAQETDQAELGEAERAAAQKVFAGIAARAGATNEAGASEVTTTWRGLPGTDGIRALQVDLALERPGFLWMRQVKFRRGGIDHTIAAYAPSAVERAAVESVLEEFLAAYRGDGRPGVVPVHYSEQR